MTGPETALPAERRGALRRDLAVRRAGRVLVWTVPWIALAFLWIPILVLIAFSFNDAESVSAWRGFSLRWYRGIVQSGVGSGSFRTELLVAGVSTALATTIGTMFAPAVTRGRFAGRRVVDALYYLRVVIPDITQGVALAVFFRLAFDAVELVTGHRFVTGFATIVIGHVAFNTAYVLIVVRARLAAMDPTLEEAAQDLGADRFQTFWRVTFPILAPGVMAGGLLAFTLSLDDFVVTFFTAGVGTTTLPLSVAGRPAARSTGGQGTKRPGSGAPSSRRTSSLWTGFSPSPSLAIDRPVARSTQTVAGPRPGCSMRIRRVARPAISSSPSTSQRTSGWAHTPCSGVAGSTTALSRTATSSSAGSNPAPSCSHAVAEPSDQSSSASIAVAPSASRAV